MPAKNKKPNTKNKKVSAVSRSVGAKKTAVKKKPVAKVAKKTVKKLASKKPAAKAKQAKKASNKHKRVASKPKNTQKTKANALAKKAQTKSKSNLKSNPKSKKLTKSKPKAKVVKAKVKTLQKQKNSVSKKPQKKLTKNVVKKAVKQKKVVQTAPKNKTVQPLVSSRANPANNNKTAPISMHGAHNKTPPMPVNKPVKKIETPEKPMSVKTLTLITPKRHKRPGAGPAGFLPYAVKAGEDYMNEAQLAHFQAVLNLWKEQLYADRDATTQHMRDDTVNFPDPLDRAALEEEHALEWRAREREHRLIAKIDQALVSIKQGDYGYCDACGAEIGIRRLEARPTATQCIDCKTIDEIRERHSGSSE